MAKILIVDDSNLSRRTLRVILENAGHKVVEASEGMIALELYFLEKPDLVLLDLVMSGMDGMEVLARLREMDKDARIIVATADIQTSTREIVKAAGALDFVSKPFTSDPLLKAINAVLSSAEGRV
jgi:two-component system, chemotaxis family, chemotaxis protein CheY